MDLYHIIYIILFYYIISFIDVKYYFNYSPKILNNYSFMSLLKPKSLDSPLIVLHLYTIKPIVIGGG